MQLEISTQKIDMIRDILDAANVQNCGESNAIVDDTDENNGVCRPGYTGANCREISDICIAQDPCDHNGICRPNGSDFTCDCPIGYTGSVCQHSAIIKMSGHFKGNGYIELNRTTIGKKESEKEILIAVMFSTTHPNGLLIWYGQNKDEVYNGQDFIALAIVDGYIEFAFRLNSEESVIKSIQARVDDGQRHVAIMKRAGSQASLELDNLTTYGESRPTKKKESYLPGNVFIGKIPKIQYNINLYKISLYRWRS